MTDGMLCKVIKRFMTALSDYPLTASLFYKAYEDWRLVDKKVVIETKPTLVLKAEVKTMFEHFVHTTIKSQRYTSIRIHRIDIPDSNRAIITVMCSGMNTSKSFEYNAVTKRVEVYKGER